MEGCCWGGDKEGAFLIGEGTLCTELEEDGLWRSNEFAKGFCDGGGGPFAC